MSLKKGIEVADLNCRHDFAAMPAQTVAAVAKTPASKS